MTMQNRIVDLIGFIINDNTSLLLLIASGMPLIAIALIIAHLRKVKQDIRRRVTADPGSFSAKALAPHKHVLNRLQSAIENLATLSGGGEDGGKAHKQLQFKLIQAGYFNRNAVTLFFGLRLVAASVAVLLAAGIMMITGHGDSLLQMAQICTIAFIIGYFLPAIALGRRLNALKLEHRTGFPDFMDLMVVCSQAGMSMEAAMKRISDELALSYPSLARHLELATIEIRSGKTLSRAVESFARRLGIEEAASFATLLAQSEELGSSLSQSLRAYSDDMRNKRLMKAEEKAFALPAKLVVPLTLFVFPTLLIVIMLPVVIAVTRSAA